MNDEIDIIDILKKIYDSKKFILYFSLIFLLIGVGVSLFSTVKYSSSTVFIPQNQESNNSSLSGVASLVGINLGASSYGGDIPPSMYPQIGNSPKFRRLILDKIIDESKKLTLKNFLIDFHKLKNENKKASSSIFMTEIEEKCFEILSDIISISVNAKDGFVTISSEMPIAEYSAIVVNESKEILQKIIIENKIETAQQNLNFSEERLAEKRLEFDEIQSKLAYFSDSNLNTVNSFVINEKGKLEAEFQIISTVVTELAKQVEQAKLQVTKDTPVFSTIAEALVPIKKTSPQRILIVLVFGFSGFIISCIFILIKDTLKDILYQISK